MSAAAPLTEPGMPSPLSTATRSQSNEAVLYGCLSLLMFAPLAFGAVEPWATLVLQAGAGILLLLWCLRQINTGLVTFQSSPIFVPMLAFGGIVAIQLIPGLSSYRHETSSCLLLFIAYATVCFLLTQTLRRTTDVRRISTILSIFGTTVALLAVLQSLSSGGKLYWFRTPRLGGWIYGPYVNHNHYAGLMEMLAPIPLVFAFTRYAHGRRRWLAATAAAFMGATIFLSGSRGGMAAFCIQMALFFWFLFRERARSGVALVFCAFLLVTLASIAWIGGGEVSDRISSMATGKQAELSLETRTNIYRDSLHMFAKRPILGWGLGTFPDVYPRFRTFYTNLFVNRAHNDYLALLTETGLLGFCAGLWFVIGALRSAFRKARNWPADVNGAVALVAILGISGILVHSLVDSNLQIPANAMLFYALCAVAALEPRFRNHRRERPPQSYSERNLADSTHP